MDDGGIGLDFDMETFFPSLPPMTGLVAGERGIRESLVTLGAAVAKFKRRLIEGY